MNETTSVHSQGLEPPIGACGVNLTVTSLLLAAVVLGPLASMQGAGSMAVGVLTVSVGFVFLALLVGRRADSFRRVDDTWRTALVILIVVVGSTGLSFLSQPDVDASRSLASVGLLFAFVAGSLCQLFLVSQIEEGRFDDAVRKVWLILAIAGVMGVFHISPFSSIHLKAVVFFNEPSHYALSFLPFAAYMSARSSMRWRIFHIAVIVILALALENLTLLVGAGLISLLTLRIKSFVLMMPLVAVSIVSAGIDYYSSRLDFSQDSTNFSTLVYISGWERAYIAIRDTYGLGLGFQQFGVFGDQGEVSKVIFQFAGSHLNVLDGGTVGAKFIGEFGIIGVIALISYLYFAFRTGIYVKRTIEFHHSSKDLFFACCFLMFSIDIFIRGVAYFSSSGQLFMTSLLWLGSGGFAALGAGSPFRNSTEAAA